MPIRGPDCVPFDKQTSIALIASARPTATFGLATQLFIAYHRQYRPQPLVVGNGTLVDLANLVEGAVIEFDPPVTD
jgi:hypothetical protein